MPTVESTEYRNGRPTRTNKTPTVKNRVIVNADSEDEAARKGEKYFRYTSRDAYAIESVKEMAPGKWMVTGLIRNPHAQDSRNNYQPYRHNVQQEEVREPFDDPSTQV